MELIKENYKKKIKRKIIKFIITKILPVFLSIFIALSIVAGIYETASDIFNHRSYSMLSLLKFKGGKLRPDIYTRYANMILSELVKQGVDTSYLPILLGQCQQESDGVPPDIFQASESKYGGRIGMIQTPEESVEQVVKRYKEITEQIKGKNLPFSIELLLQTYNFGSGYLDFVKSNGGVHSQRIAEIFSKTEVNKPYFQELFPGAQSYGDPMYVEHVMRYVDTTSLIGGEKGIAQTDNANIQKMLNEAYTYQGTPYYMGGVSRGGIDCSGLVLMSLNNVGIECPRLADDQFYYFRDKGFEVHRSLSEAKVGDLIFFRDTYPVINPEGISHVGFYLGNGKMFDASSGSVDFHNIGEFWENHFYASITIFK